MRQVTQSPPHETLERILNALEQELIEASEAEILEAANDLGMKPGMKGSAAFLGLRYSSALRDFFAGGLTPEVRAGIEQLRRTARRPRLAHEDPPPPRPRRGPRARKKPDKDN